MSTFSGIGTALSALSAHRKAMDVIGQNIANVNTPGYTRQRAELTEVVSRSGVSLQGASRTTGNGVEVASISRAYDALMAEQVNTRTADHALLSGRAATLSKVEGLTNEPGTSGLSSALNKMWSAWSAASTAVGSTGESAARTVVVGAARTVADTLRSGYAGIAQLYTAAAGQAQAGVLELNAAASDVAKLNELIQKATVTGGSANELMDQRDQLVTRIVELTGATTEAGPNGQVNVLVGGSPLVQGNQSQRAEIGTPLTLDDARGGAPVTVTIGGATAAFSSGQLAADVEALRTTLPGTAESYDAVAARLAADVNALQTQDGARDGTGKVSSSDEPTTAVFGGGPPVTASNITVLTSPGELALGVDGRGASDGSNAKAIAALGSATGGADAGWRSYVSGLAATSASAAQRSTAALQMLTNAVTDQQGYSGVSLDEETAELVSAQRAYQGAARVLTAVDEMLDTLINKTGLVGR